MNILFLTQRVPYPPDRGDRIATYHYLQHFWARGDRVRIGCLSAEEDREALAYLGERAVAVCAPKIDERRNKILALRGLLTGKPLTLPFFANRQLAAQVREWVREDPPDVVIVYSSSMAQYAVDIPDAIRVMYFAELDSDKWRQYAARRGPGPGRWIYGREARLLLEFEREIARTFDASAVVSEVEKDLFLEYIPEVTPHVIPNGVDVEHFSSAGDDRRELHTIVFTGVMDYEPNVDGVLWFAAEVWPELKAKFPLARFLVVGNRPTPAIRALEEVDGITVTGWVESTTPYFDESAVCVAPLRIARGLQNKVLEAMSMGLPVVATTPAAQGLGVVPADTLVVEDSARAIADAISALFESPESARAIGARAAAFVRDHFHWSNTYAKLDTMIQAPRGAAAPTSSPRR